MYTCTSVSCLLLGYIFWQGLKHKPFNTCRPAALCVHQLGHLLRLTGCMVLGEYNVFTSDRWIVSWPELCTSCNKQPSRSIHFLWDISKSIKRFQAKPRSRPFLFQPSGDGVGLRSVSLECPVFFNSLNHSQSAPARLREHSQIARLKIKLFNNNLWSQKKFYHQAISVCKLNEGVFPTTFILGFNFPGSAASLFSTSSLKPTFIIGYWAFTLFKADITSS